MATENITLQSCCCCTQHPRCQTPTAAVRNSTSISRNLHKMPLIMHAPFLEEKLGWQSFGEKKEIRMPLYFPHQGSWQACIFNRLIALQITIYTNWSVEKVMSISHQTSSTTNIYLCHFQSPFSAQLRQSFSAGSWNFPRKETKSRPAWRKRSKTVKETTTILQRCRHWSTIPPLFIGSWLPRRYKEFGCVLGTTIGCMLLDRSLIEIGENIRISGLESYH